ncbi:FAD-dependent oxidoreductase [Bradyrhizobium diazoefficiens]|nr:FAD-dependent oxidoreductase [Bradyrhizobium diazoefficiens]
MRAACIEAKALSLESGTCDVLVAGSGAGGFAAALAARLHGLDVIMVEKEPLFGGTTAYSAGVIWIPVNTHEKAAGIPDTREDALAYLAHHVGNRLERAKAEAFVDNAPAMLDQFEREGIAAFTLVQTWPDYHPDEPGASKGGRSLGSDEYDGRALGPWFTKLRPPIKTMTAFGGMMIGRSDLPHVFRMTKSLRSALHVGRMMARHIRDRLSHSRGTRLVNGNALVARLAVSAFQRGIPLWLNSPVVELVCGGGQVTGAVVERDGKRLELKVRRGVVLACGGFPANDDLKRRVYANAAASKNHVLLAPPGNTGDGLRLARSAGGTLHDELHQPAAWTPVSLVPQTDGSSIPFPHFFDRGKPGYISVDRRGRRFVNEALSYHVFVPALVEACRGDQQAEAWIVCDHRAIRRFGLGALGPAPLSVRPFLRSGYIQRSNTVRGLAEACGIDAAGLERTISEFNGPAQRGEDHEFQRGSDAYQHFSGAPGHKPNPCIAPLDKPPFYAVRVIPSELGTFAGIQTNASAQVIDSDGQPIAGLYAVGNDAASVMGGTYPGAGITIGPAMTFGYIAGRHLAGLGSESIAT